MLALCNNNTCNMPEKSRYVWHFGYEFSIIFPILFTVLRINDSYIRLPTYCVLIVAFLYAILRERFPRKPVTTLIVLVVIFVVHFSVLSISNRNGTIQNHDYILWFSLNLTLFIILSTLATKASDEIYERMFIKLGVAALSIAFFLWMVSFVFGVNFGVDRGAGNTGFPRAQGLFTEPSNLAYVVPALLIYGIDKRNWFIFLLAITVLLISLSPTVLFACVGLLAVYVFMKAKTITRLTLIVSFVMLSLNAKSFLESLIEFIPADNPFSNVISRLIAGILFFVDSDSGAWANSRGVLIRDWSSIMSDGNYWITGAGLGTSVPIAMEKYNGGTFDITLWATISVWFGVAGLFMFYALLIYALQRIPPTRFFFWIYLSTIITSSINHGGIYFQFSLVVMTIIALRMRNTNLTTSSASNYQTTFKVRLT